MSKGKTLASAITEAFSEVPDAITEARGILSEELTISSEEFVEETLESIAEGDTKTKCLKEMEDMTTIEKQEYLKKCKEEGVLDDEVKMKY